MHAVIRSYLVSLLIHAGVAGGSMALFGGMPIRSEAVTIDLSLMNLTCSNDETVAAKNRPVMTAVRQPCPIVPHRTVPSKTMSADRPATAPTAPSVVQQAQAASPVATEVRAADTQLTAADSNAPYVQHTTPQGASTVTRAAGSAPGQSGESALQEQYTKEHFAYIQKIINQKIRYPRAARIRGEEGTVVVVFTIKKDGNISHPQIASGSGHALLDENAVNAIQSAAPFPRPPIVAQMRVPVVYRLTSL